MVTKLDKEETIKELEEKFSKAEAAYAVDQERITGKENTEFRKELLKLDAEYKVAKNTLFKISAKGTQFEPLVESLNGPTALLFCYGDTTAPAGFIKKYSKSKEDKIKFKASFMDGELLDEKETLEVAGLPSKEVLLSQIAGQLVSPLSGIAYIFQELGNKDGEDKKLKEFFVDSPATEEAPKEEEKAEAAPAEEAKSEEGGES